MIDVAKMRKDAQRLSSNECVRCLLAALDELEAMRKPARGVTDAQVEEAAIQAWLGGGHGRTRSGWAALYPNEVSMWTEVGRAVLEYAATLNLAPVATPPLAGHDCDCRGACGCHASKSREIACLDDDRSGCGHYNTGREERLTRYRCAVMQGYAANWNEMHREWMCTPDDGKTRGFDAWLVAKAEHIAHAMLAAEKEPTDAQR